MNTVIIYTDGACDPNPGTGGWAAILIKGGHKKILTGGQRDTTNNRMELTAAIEALRALTQPCTVTLFTDSEYVRNAIVLGWLKNWIKKGWRNSGGPVKNRDLWEQLLEQIGRHQIDWHWVRGHDSDPLNNECDRLAVEARLKIARES
jgi:ribonuclease HI